MTKALCAHPLCSDEPYAWVGHRRGLCRAHYLEHQYFQRRQRAREKYSRRTPREPASCGTPAAAARHRRRKEPVCTDCRRADAEATARRKRERSS